MFTLPPSQEPTPRPTNPCQAITNCYDCITSSNSTFNETACYWYRDCSVNDIPVTDACNTLIDPKYISCGSENDMNFGNDNLTTCIARDNVFGYISIVALCTTFPLLVLLLCAYYSQNSDLKRCLESRIVVSRFAHFYTQLVRVRFVHLLLIHADTRVAPCGPYNVTRVWTVLCARTVHVPTQRHQCGPLNIHAAGKSVENPSTAHNIRCTRMCICGPYFAQYTHGQT